MERKGFHCGSGGPEAGLSEGGGSSEVTHVRFQAERTVLGADAFVCLVEAERGGEPSVGRAPGCLFLPFWNLGAGAVLFPGAAPGALEPGSGTRGGVRMEARPAARCSDGPVGTKSLASCFRLVF